MNDFEEFLFKWTGKIICIVSAGCFILTVYFDCLSRGILFKNSTFGHLQITGMVFFFGFYVFGVMIDGMLRKAKHMIDEILAR